MSTRSAIAIVLAAAGCGSVTTYQSADVLPRGTWSVALAASAGGFTDTEQETKIPTGAFELAGRVGVGGDTDVGLKLYTAGIEASVRHQIADGRWAWALLGSLGGVVTDEDSPVGAAGLTQLRLGAVATKHRSTTWGWNMGPIATFSLLRPAGGGTAGGALIGGFVGFDWRFADVWHLTPELSLHVTAAGEVPVAGSVGMLGVAISREL
ncbi:MAG: hypothetical protein JNL83_05770 [Myxococcales bacterium]|nr:hypothetical protein [Myxococcales bacterium]